jgi:hypothetical protein
MASLLARRWILPPIQQAFSEFLEGVNSKSFEADLWNGRIVLKNIRFKPGALDGLDGVPPGCHIPESNIASMEISVPWTRLSEEATVVTIRDVDVLVVRSGDYVAEARRTAAETSPSSGAGDNPDPHGDAIFDDDAAAVSSTAWTFKQHHIDIVMRALHKRFESISPQHSGNAAARRGGANRGSKKGRAARDEEWESAGTMGRLALRVLDNMQLDIKNVHVRFEDRLSNPECPFAAGIFCQELSFFTTNANFKKAIRDRGISKQEYTHKRAVCQKLGVYWASHPANLVSRSTGAHAFTSSGARGGKNMEMKMTPIELKRRLAAVLDSMHRGGAHGLSASSAGVPRTVLPPLNMDLFIVRFHGADTEINRETPRTSMTLQFRQEHATPDAAHRHAVDDASRIKLSIREDMLVDVSAIMEPPRNDPLVPPLTSASEDPFAWWRYFVALKREQSRQKYKQWHSTVQSFRAFHRYKQLWIALSRKKLFRGTSDDDVRALVKKILHMERYALTVTAVVNARSEVFSSYRVGCALLEDLQRYDGAKDVSSGSSGRDQGTDQTAVVADGWGMSWLFGSSSGRGGSDGGGGGDSTATKHTAATPTPVTTTIPTALPSSLRVKSEDIARIGSELLEANFLNIQFVFDLGQLSVVAIDKTDTDILVGNVGGVTKVKIYADGSWASELTLRRIQVIDPISGTPVLGRRFCMNDKSVGERATSEQQPQQQNNGTALLSLAVTSFRDYTDSNRVGVFTTDLHLASMQICMNAACMARVQSLLMTTMSMQQRANFAHAAKARANIIQEGIAEEIHGILTAATPTTTTTTITASGAGGDIPTFSGEGKKNQKKTEDGHLLDRGDMRSEAGGQGKEWMVDVYIKLNAPIIVIPLDDDGVGESEASAAAPNTPKRTAVFDLGQLLVVHGPKAEAKMHRQTGSYSSGNINATSDSIRDQDAWNIYLRATQFLVVNCDSKASMVWQESVLKRESPFHIFSSEEFYAKVRLGPRHEVESGDDRCRLSLVGAHTVTAGSLGHNVNRDERCLWLEGHSSHVLLQISSFKVQAVNDVFAVFGEDNTSANSEAYAQSRAIGHLSRIRADDDTAVHGVVPDGATAISTCILSSFELRRLQVKFEVVPDPGKLEQAVHVADASLLDTQLECTRNITGDSHLRLVMSQLHVWDSSETAGTVEINRQSGAVHAQRIASSAIASSGGDESENDTNDDDDDTLHFGDFVEAKSRPRHEKSLSQSHLVADGESRWDASKLIWSGESHQLIEIGITMPADPLTKVVVSCSFGSLHVEFNPETLAKIHSIIMGIGEEPPVTTNNVPSFDSCETIASPESKTGGPSSSYHTTSAASSWAASAALASTFTRKLDIEIIMHSISVNLNKPRLRRRVAEISLTGGTMSYKRDAEGSDCTSWSVGNISILDACSVGSLNRQMFGIIQTLSSSENPSRCKNFMEGSFKRTMLDAATPDRLANHMDLELHPGCTIVFLNNWWQEMMDYLTNGIVAGVIASVTEAANPAALKGLSADNLDPALRLTFSMRALRPTIFVPCHAQTKQGLALVVDKLTCSNSVSIVGQKGGEPGVLHDHKFWDVYEDDETAAENAEVYLEQKIVVNLINTWVETHTGKHLTRAPVSDIDVFVHQMLDPMSAHLALDMHASVRVPECRLSIVRDDYVLVQSILVSNIGAPRESLIMASSGARVFDASVANVSSGTARDSVSSPDFAVAFEYGGAETHNRFVMHADVAALELDVSFVDKTLLSIDRAEESKSTAAKPASEAPLRFVLQDLGYNLDSTVKTTTRLSAFIDDMNISEVVAAVGISGGDGDTTTGRCLFSATTNNRQDGARPSEKLVSYSSTREESVSTSDRVHLEPFLISVHPTLVNKIIPFFSIEDEELVVPEQRREAFLAEQELAKGMYKLEIIMIEATAQLFVQHDKPAGEMDKVVAVMSGELMYTVQNPLVPETNDLKVNMSDFRCYRVDYMMPDVKHAMLSRTSAKLRVHRGVRDQQNYIINISAVEITLAFRDYDLFQEIVQNWPDAEDEDDDGIKLSTLTEAALRAATAVDISTSSHHRSNPIVEGHHAVEKITGYASSSPSSSSLSSSEDDDDEEEDASMMSSDLHSTFSPSFSPLRVTSQQFLESVTSLPSLPVQLTPAGGLRRRRRLSAASNVPESHASKFGLDISLKDCSLTLVDDLEGRFYRILRLDLAHCNSFINSLPHIGQQVAGVKLSAGVSYFDHKSESWQRCTLNQGGLALQMSYLQQMQQDETNDSPLSFSRNSGNGSGGGGDGGDNGGRAVPSNVVSTEISLDSDEIVRLQVTSTMIRSIHTAYRRWNDWQDQHAERITAHLSPAHHTADGKATDGGSITDDFGPFLVRNHSGVLVTVQGRNGVCAAGPKGRESAQDVASGSHAYFRMRNSPRSVIAASPRSTTQRTATPSLSLRLYGIKGAKGDVGTTVSLYDLGVHRFRIEDALAGERDNVFVYISISENDGYTVVEVHSGMWLENRCSVFDLEVRAGGQVLHQVPDQQASASSELIGICKRQGGRFYLPLNLTSASDIQVRPRGNILECDVPLGSNSLGVTLVPCRGSTGILVASVGKKKASGLKASDATDNGPSSQKLGFLEKTGVRVGSELRCIDGHDVHMLSFTDAFRKLKLALKRQHGSGGDDDASSSRPALTSTRLTFLLPMVVTGGIPMHAKFEWSGAVSLHAEGNTVLTGPWSSTRGDLGVFLRVRIKHLGTGTKVATFEAPLHVRNCLPQVARMRFVQRKAGKKSQHELDFPSGQEHEVYTVNTLQSLLAQLKMDGFVCGKSEYMRLPSVFEQTGRNCSNEGAPPANSAREGSGVLRQVVAKNITIHDMATQMPLDITLHVSLIGDIVRLDLRSEFWIVNQSGLPLQYRSGNHEHWKHWRHLPAGDTSPVVPPLRDVGDTRPRLVGYIGSSDPRGTAQAGVGFFPKPRRGSVGRASASGGPPLNKMAIRVAGTSTWSPPFDVGEAGSHTYVGLALLTGGGKKINITCIVENGPITFGLGSMRVLRVVARHNIRLISPHALWVRQIVERGKQGSTSEIRLEPAADNAPPNPSPLYCTDHREGPIRIQLSTGRQQVGSKTGAAWSTPVVIDTASAYDNYLEIKDAGGEPPLFCCVSTEMFGVFQLVTTLRVVTEREYRKHFARLAESYEKEALQIASFLQANSGRASSSFDNATQNMARLFDQAEAAREKSIHVGRRRHSVASAGGSEAKSTPTRSSARARKKSLRIDSLATPSTGSEGGGVDGRKSTLSVRCKILGVVIELNKVVHASAMADKYDENSIAGFGASSGAGSGTGSGAGSGAGAGSGTSNTRIFFRKVAELRVLRAEARFDRDVDNQHTLWTCLKRVAILDATKRHLRQQRDGSAALSRVFLCGGAAAGEDRPAFLLQLRTAPSHTVAIHIKECYVKTATILVDTGESFFRELQFVLLQIRGGGSGGGRGIGRSKGVGSGGGGGDADEEGAPSWNMLEYFDSLEHPWTLLRGQYGGVRGTHAGSTTSTTTNVAINTNEENGEEKDVSDRHLRQIKRMRRRLQRRRRRRQRRKKRFHLIRMDLFQLNEIHIVFSFARCVDRVADAALVTSGGIALGDILGGDAMDNIPPVEKVRLALPVITQAALGEAAAVRNQITEAVGAALTKYVMNNLKMLLFQNPDMVIHMFGTQARKMVGVGANAIGSVAADVGGLLGGVLETGFSLATFGLFSNGNGSSSPIDQALFLRDLCRGVSRQFPKFSLRSAKRATYARICQRHVEMMTERVQSLPWLIYTTRSLTHSIFFAALAQGTRKHDVLAPCSIAVVVLNCTASTQVVIHSAREGNPQPSACDVLSLPFPMTQTVSPNCNMKLVADGGQGSLARRGSYHAGNHGTALPWDPHSARVLYFFGNMPPRHLPSYNHTGPNIECSVRSSAFDLFIKVDGSVELIDKGVTMASAAAEAGRGGGAARLGASSSYGRDCTVSSLAAYRRFQHFAEYIVMVGQRF